MKLGPCSGILAFAAVFHASPGPVGPGTDAHQGSRLEGEAFLESPGELTVRARCVLDGIRIFVDASGTAAETASGTAAETASGGMDGIPKRIVAGAACPWLAVGPLETGGLLRLAASPLAFSARSAAWRERTRLAPDPGLYPSRVGIAAFPLPDTFCLYFHQAGDGTEEGPREAGLFMSLFASNSLLTEAVLSACGPDVPSASCEWYVPRAHWAGGLLGRTACRLAVFPPSGTVSLASGASFGGSGAPGAFVQAAAAFQAAASSGAAVLACCGRDYMAPDGRGPTDLAAASAEAALGDPEAARISASYSFRIAQPGPVPARYLATRSGTNLEVLRVFALDPQCGLALRGRAEKSQEWDTEGFPSGSASTEWGLGLQAGAWNGEATLSLEDGGTWEAGMEAAFGTGGEAGRLEASGVLSFRFPQKSLCAEWDLMIRFRNHQLSIRVWLDDCAMGADPSAVPESAGFSVGWKSRIVIPR